MIDPSTPAQPSSSRKPKKNTKKSEAFTPQEGEDAVRPTTSRNTNSKKGRPNPSVPEQALENYDDSDDDEMLDEERIATFRSDFLGGGPGGLSSSARALISGIIPPSGIGGQLRMILENLRQHEDPSVQRAALEELSSVLLMANEDTLNGQFSPDSFVKELVVIMQGEGVAGPNPEMMLLACRCIASLIEALPQASHSVVGGGAVPILCQKLIEIDYIDLAEQALITLEKISDDYPGSIVRAGGLTACLTFLDFFATPTQRTAVTAAAKCCRDLSDGSFPMIKDVMPILLGVLAQSDQKVVEQGSLCITRIVSSFEGHPQLDELVTPALLQAIIRLLLPGSTNLIGLDIHTQFLHLLAIVARSSPTLSAELFKMSVVDTLYQILTGVSPPEETEDSPMKFDSVLVMQALIHRPREQIFETLNIICELLPEVQQENLTEATSSKTSTAEYKSAINRPRKQAMNIRRLELLENCRDNVKRFVMILLPTLTHAYSSTVNFSVRMRVLGAQLKMLSNVDPSILESALRAVPFASFLASILSQQDHSDLVLQALQAVELLLLRLRNIYAYQFCREGVIAEISKLAEKSLSDRSKPTDGSMNDYSIADHPVHHAHESDSGEEIMEIEEGEEEGDGDDDDNDEDDAEEARDVDGDDHADIHEDASPSPTTASEEVEPPYREFADSIDNLVIKKARKILGNLQDSQSVLMRQQADQILAAMMSLARNLAPFYMSDDAKDSQKGEALFRSLARYFSADALDSITSAELLKSGIVDALVDIFDNGLSQRSRDARSDFLQIFMAEAQRGPSNSSPLNILVHKLQDLLSRAEHFEVITIHSSSSEASRSSVSSQLSKQLRLKLVADENSDIPERWRSIMVSIHAITSFKSLDDYLRPRMTLHEHSRIGRREVLSTLAALAGSPGGPHHHRFMERSLLSLHEPSPPSLPAPQRDSSNRSERERIPSRSNSAQDQDARNEDNSTHRRTSKRHQPPQRTPQSPHISQDLQEQLECADERQITDEVSDSDRVGLDAFVEDLEEGLQDSPITEPEAVNLEVASTGKVTARREDGTRVPTPSQASQMPASLAPPTRAHGGSASPLTAPRAMSYAAAAQAIPQDWHLEFSVDGQVITPGATIYGAVHSDRANSSEITSRGVWNTTHAVTFKKVPGPPPPASISSSLSSRKDSTRKSKLPESLQNQPSTFKILRLLEILHDLNENVEDVLQYRHARQTITRSESEAQFINTKLTAKLNRQLEEPLIVASGCLPLWSRDLAQAYPFLFPFETRYLFLQSTFFGNQRSMERWMTVQSEESRRDRRRDDRPYLTVPKKQKVRISRGHILESAIKVLNQFAKSETILEVEYFDEVGTGLGPTLEFYSNVSKEFSKKKYKMWRETDSGARDEYAFGKCGLFPAPMTKAQVASPDGEKVLSYFSMLGKFVARSMLDSRMIDVSFNPMFFKSRELASDPLNSLAVIKAVDPGLASSLKLIKQFVQAKKGIKTKSMGSKRNSQTLRELNINGVKLDHLGLDFTLPGYPDIELVDNGANLGVSHDNVEKYLEKVVDLTVGSGVDRQIREFQSGFESVFTYTALKSFTAAELVMLFGRSEEDWSLESKSLVMRLSFL